MPLNHWFAWARSHRIKQQLKKEGLDRPAANMPIVYIPGIIGSKLFDTYSRTNIWGDPLPLIRPKSEHAPFILGEEEGLHAWENREKKGGVNHFPRVIATEQLHYFSLIPGLLDTLVTQELKLVLQNALGYQEGRDLFFMGHDWRQDYRLLSLQLDKKLNQIKDVYGEKCKIAIIGQSVASMAVKYWLLNTQEKNLENIARWYSFGPPLQGTFHALSMLHEGYYPATQRFKGFTPADISSCPSCYQLLPGNPNVLTEKGERIEDVSFYDMAYWEKFGLGPWHPALKMHLTPKRLEAYLKLGREFREALEQNNERLDAVSQAWFLGEANRAVRSAVFANGKLLVTAKAIEKEAPHLVEKALTRGDDHLPLEDFATSPNGPFVKDKKQIPYGEKYMLVSRPKDHRALINSGTNLRAIAFDLATVRRGYNQPKVA